MITVKSKHNNNSKELFQKVLLYIDTIFINVASSDTAGSVKILTEGLLYKGSWMFSARRTYFDKFVDMYYNYKDKNSPGNYYFWDTHLKLKFAPNNTNQFFYSQFSGKDDLFLGIGGS